MAIHWMALASDVRRCARLRFTTKTVEDRGALPKANKAPCISVGRDPNGIRTRVTAVKGRCPRPLDDRVDEAAQYSIRWQQGNLTRFFK